MRAEIKMAINILIMSALYVTICVTMVYYALGYDTQWQWVTWNLCVMGITVSEPFLLLLFCKQLRTQLLRLVTCGKLTRFCCDGPSADEASTAITYNHKSTTQHSVMKY